MKNSQNKLQAIKQQLSILSTNIENIADHENIDNNSKYLIKDLVHVLNVALKILDSMLLSAEKHSDKI